MRALRQINGIMLLCAFTMIAVAQNISPELTRPRIGDKLNVYKLSNEPRWIDTLSLCPDLSRTEYCRTEQMKIWSPAKTDSVSYCLVAKGRETSQLILRHDTLYQYNQLTPGRTKIYSPMPAYGKAGNAMTQDTIKSTGTTDGVGNYETSGIWTTRTIKGLSAITFDNDTLINVECVETAVDEILTYIHADTTIYRGKVCRWYAPGYRYPILEHESGILYSLAGDSIDNISSWYATDISEQRENIKDDTINQLIREQTEQLKQRHKSDSDNHKSNSKNNNNSVVYFDNSNNQLVINTPFNLSPENKTYYVICNISGIVYAHGDISPGGTIISTTGFTSGTYLTYIYDGEESIVYKFNKTER